MATSATARISSPHRYTGGLSAVPRFNLQCTHQTAAISISVFIVQAKALPLGFASAGEMDARSFHLECWQRDALQYFAISDAAPEDLRALSDLLGK